MLASSPIRSECVHLSWAVELSSGIVLSCVDFLEFECWHCDTIVSFMGLGLSVLSYQHYRRIEIDFFLSWDSFSHS